MIQRNPEQAAEATHDLVIIGGGIYGVCVALEAARRGLKPVLVERDDFGAATSWNSLRILHGGLRYLQKMDLHRFRESVGERRWFCQHFPELVRPLQCLMPLYGRGLKRPSVFRVAMRMNDWLSRHRNIDVNPAVHLGSGRILTADQTRACFTQVDTRGLKGAGLWHDAVMLNSQRVLIELLRWACACGATALNYVQADELLLEGTDAVGVRVTDRVSGRVMTVRGRWIVNCAGPWSRSLAGSFDRDIETLFRPSLAFNLLLDREPIAEAAVAVQPRRANSRIYFVQPWHGRLFAGTYHMPWSGSIDQPTPGDSHVQAMLDDLNDAIPGLNLRRDEVLRIYSGLLPARAAGSDELAVREAMHLHAKAGGPGNVLSLCGVKFTTARLVAEKALTLIATQQNRSLPAYQTNADRPACSDPSDLTTPDAFMAADDATASRMLKTLADEEAVVCLDDLLLRRTDWLADPRATNVVERVQALLTWRGPMSQDDLTSNINMVHQNAR